MLDHPDNPGHPNAFHVRDDGWMGICLPLGGAITVSKDRPLKIRYALWIHDGVASQEDCEEAWKEIVRLPPPGAE